VSIVADIMESSMDVLVEIKNIAEIEPSDSFSGIIYKGDKISTSYFH
jgi:hypothetical protein